MRFLPSTFAALLLTACAAAPDYSDEDQEYYADYEPRYEPTAESLDYPPMPDLAAPMGETATTIDLTSPSGGDGLEPVVFVPIPDAPAAMPPIASPASPPSPPRTVVFEQPKDIEATWIDAFGRRWRVAFVCELSSDEQHDQLARACFGASTMLASEVAAAVCRQFNLENFAGIEACENELARQLTRLMEHSGLTPAQASVCNVRWTHWRVD